ncbi:MAG: alkyl sulfatase dimerization domain-containing protein [Pseudohongiellaceae bacterium]
MRAQRDAYANLNNQVLFLANQGVTIKEIHNQYVVPESLQQQWNVRQYHGSEFHNSRAVLNRYLGYWDGNPATLAPLSPSDSAPLFVEMMGGSAEIIAKAEELHAAGEYRLAMEILNKLVYAEPANAQAKDLLANVFEQLGYQYESASLRNVFLAAAQELRNGIQTIAAPRGTSPSMARAMTTSQWWDSVGTRVDSSLADGNDYIVNFITPDTDQTFVIEMSSGTLSNIEGYLSDEADATITINRTDLDTVIMGQATLSEQLQNDLGSLEGDASVLLSMAAVLTVFSPGFEVLPGTLPQ